MGHIGVQVASWVKATGQSPRAIAIRAGVSPSTLGRVIAGHGAPTWSTLQDIAAACGLQINVQAAPSSDPAAAAAARLLLDESYQIQSTRHLDRWAERIEQWSQGDPVEMVKTAAMASNPRYRSGALLLSGVTVGRLAAAGQASGEQWAISGLPAVRLGSFHDGAAAAVLWGAAETRRLAHLLHGVKQSSSPQRASVIVAQAEPELFLGGHTMDGVSYVAPIQAAIDAIAMGGEAADIALKEISTW